VRKAADRLLGLFRARSTDGDGGNGSGRAVEVSLVPPKEVFGQRIQTLSDGGVELLFVYCGGEPEWFNHAGQFKGMFGQFPFHEKVGFNYLEVSDHLITTRTAQQAFLAMTDDWLTSRVLPSNR